MIGLMANSNLLVTSQCIGASLLASSASPTPNTLRLGLNMNARTAFSLLLTGSLSLAIPSCFSDPFTAAPNTSTGGSTGTMDGGTEDSGITDGGMGDAGSTDGGSGSSTPPTLLKPENGSSLPPARALLAWGPGTPPEGESISSYQLCSTDMGLAFISGSELCPNGKVISANNQYSHDVMAPLDSNRDYHWKVRANFSDDSHSDYSAIYTFSTDDSLVAWWQFNMSAGNGDTITDESGNNNIATVNSSDLENTVGNSQILGKALRFDGNEDYALVSPSTSLDSINNSSFSIEVRASSSGIQTNQSLLTRGDSDESLSNQFYSLGVISGRLVFEHRASGADLDSPQVTADTPIAINSWIHAVAVRDFGNELRLYQAGSLDGTPTADNSDSFSWASHERPLALGAFYWNTNSLDYLSGLVDEAALYNRSLRGYEILNNYCAFEALLANNPLPQRCFE